MTQENNGPFPGDPPPCLIYVDQEGRWWHLGAEMTHQGIMSLLFESVELDDQGRYLIRYQGRLCLVEVEDTLFVITRLDAETDGGGPPSEYWVTLSDGSREKLVPDTLSQNRDHVLYARVKDGRFPARFLRRSYYQLAEHIVEKNGSFVLPCGGREYELA